MNKSIIFLIGMLVISIGFFSGCVETVNNEDLTEDTEQVEIVTYKIETFGAEIGERPGKIGDGFIYNETAKNGYYQITGTIKNIAGRTLNNITIKVDLFDKNQTYLGSEITEPEDIFDLPLSDKDTADFKINIIYLYTESYFFDIDGIEINVLVGPDETTDNGDSIGETDEIELISYTIETFGGEYGLKPEKIGEGFIHNEQAKNGYYKITGTIKNIAGRMLNSITVKVDFYDINHSYLTSKSGYVENLPDTNTTDFKVIYLGNSSYFEEIEQIEFDISTS